MGKKVRDYEAPRIRGSFHLTQAGAQMDDIRSLILRRRLQVLVHSCIYYVFNNNLVSDDTWSQWAKELSTLQEEYPHIASRVDYHKEFMGFDGSTGYHLPIRNLEIMNKAQYLLNLNKEDKNGKRRHQTGRAEPGGTVVRLLLP